MDTERLRQLTKYLFYIMGIAAMLSYAAVLWVKIRGGEFGAQSYLFSSFFYAFIVSWLIRVEAAVIADKKARARGEFDDREHARRKKRNLAALILIGGIVLTTIAAWLILEADPAQGSRIIFFLWPMIFAPSLLLASVIYFLAG